MPHRDNVTEAALARGWWKLASTPLLTEGSSGRVRCRHGTCGDDLSDNATRSNPLDPRLSATHATFLDERPPCADEDVHMLTSVVDHVIRRCSEPGGVVFDPFAGFGTTIERAVALGRQGVGIELLPERANYVEKRVPSARIMQGDARDLVQIVRRGVPEQHLAVDLVLTSPPYMTAEHHETDPLTAYEEVNGDYGRYLAELGLVAQQCANIVVPGGFVVWNVADIHHMDLRTQLIRDCARVLAEHLSFVGITEIVWDRYPHDLVRDALIVFQRS